jgi:glycosyltransferase involved in cell wall biosynthesis
VRVGISLLTLARGDQGGAETYASELARSLRSAGTLEYVVLVPAPARDAAEGLETVAVRTLSFASRGPARIPSVSVSARLSRSVRRALRELDAVHYPLTVPVPKSRAPRIVTLHDLQHHDLPGLFTRAQRLFRARAYDRAVQTSSATIVPSEFVRERALELLAVDPRRVHVVPHGVDHGLFRPSDGAGEQAFLLYPARPWPHKNHRRLFQAFVDLRRERPDLRLVLTGGGVERLKWLPGGAEPLGLVSREELASLYRRAACLVFPSLHEGFGLPALEAMASGCPVAAARAGALPEVCGDAAVLFDPADVHAIADGIRDALARADELRALGLARASAFTWERSARRHEDVYRASAVDRPERSSNS